MASDLTWTGIAAEDEADAREDWATKMVASAINKRKLDRADATRLRSQELMTAAASAAVAADEMNKEAALYQTRAVAAAEEAKLEGVINLTLGGYRGVNSELLGVFERHNKVVEGRQTFKKRGKKIRGHDWYLYYYKPDPLHAVGTWKVGNAIGRPECIWEVKSSAMTADTIVGVWKTLAWTYVPNIKAIKYTQPLYLTRSGGRAKLRRTRKNKNKNKNKKSRRNSRRNSRRVGKKSRRVGKMKTRRRK